MSTRLKRWIGYGIIIFVVLAAFALINLSKTVALYEEGMLAIDPTADRAYIYGSRHLDAIHSPKLYDIDLAERFLTQALALDPEHTMVRHQLARVAFLRGDLKYALYLIDLQIVKFGDLSPSSYYMRGLILGYMDKFDASAESYKKYLTFDPTNWAGHADLAWVLIKAQKYDEALATIGEAQKYFVTNPWLLNAKAIALYELRRYKEAYVAASAANASIQTLTEEKWSIAYPGNDPLIARDGLEAFKKAVEENMHTIFTAMQKQDNGVQ